MNTGCVELSRFLSLCRDVALLPLSEAQVQPLLASRRAYERRLAKGRRDSQRLRSKRRMSVGDELGKEEEEGETADWGAVRDREFADIGAADSASDGSGIGAGSTAEGGAGGEGGTEGADGDSESTESRGQQVALYPLLLRAVRRDYLEAQLADAQSALDLAEREDKVGAPLDAPFFRVPARDASCQAQPTVVAADAQTDTSGGAELRLNAETDFVSGPLTSDPETLGATEEGRLALIHLPDGTRYEGQVVARWQQASQEGAGERELERSDDMQRACAAVCVYMCVWMPVRVPGVIFCTVFAPHTR